MEKGGLFQDLRILFTSVSEKEKTSLQELCRGQGAAVLSTATPNDPPHVIVTRRVGSPKYLAVLRRHPRTPVVAPEWISNSLSSGKRIPYAQYSVGACYGLKVCLSGFQAQEKARLANLIQNNGGVHSPSLTKQCTHLVSNSCESEKYKFAQKYGIVCASAQWLTDSGQVGWCKDESQYPVDGRSNDGVATQKKDNIDIKNQANHSRASLLRRSSSAVVTDSLTLRPTFEQSGDIAMPSKGEEQGLKLDGRNDKLRSPFNDLEHRDEGTTFLDAVGVWVVGCSLQESLEVLQLCRVSGAKRFTFPHKSLVTHILKGTESNALDAREIMQFLESNIHVPVVNIGWLQRSVARQQVLPVDERFTVSRTELERIYKNEFSKGVGHNIPPTLASNELSVSSSLLAGRRGGMSGFLDDCYFTMAAIRGTSEESRAETLVRKNGGKIFNSALPTQVLARNRIFAICPASLPPVYANKLKSQQLDFNTVPENNRFTLYWLECCVEAGQLLTPQRGSPCFRPLPFPLPLDGMSRISVAISGYDPAVRNAIKHTVETLGGSVSMDCMSANDTHLLVPAAYGEKFRHSKRLGVIPVTADWLVDTVVHGRLLSEDNYKPRPVPGRSSENTTEQLTNPAKIEQTQMPFTDYVNGNEDAPGNIDLLASQAATNISNDAQRDVLATGFLADKKQMQKNKRRKSAANILPSLLGSSHDNRNEYRRETKRMQGSAGHVRKTYTKVQQQHDGTVQQKTRREIELDEAVRNVSSILGMVENPAPNGSQKYTDFLNESEMAGHLKVPRQFKRKTDRKRNLGAVAEKTPPVEQMRNSEAMLDGLDVSQRVGYGMSPDEEARATLNGDMRVLSVNPDKNNVFQCKRQCSRFAGSTPLRPPRAWGKVPVADVTSHAGINGSTLSGKKLPIAYSPEWMALREHVKEVQQLHLKDLLLDEERTDSLIREHNGIYVDFSRQNMTDSTLQLLLNLAERAKLRTKMNAMFAGEHINATEDRAVLHTALRAPRESRILVEGKDVVPDVWEVLDKIKKFSEKVRSGEWTGVSGKPLRNVVAIGIGGSYLGPAFIHTALQFDEGCKEEARGRKLRFLANVDPVDVAKALHELDPETTLVVVISKTFTTTETMLNARTVRTWLTTELAQLGFKAEETVAKHMVAVSTNLEAVSKFGIDPENAFGFWDWVGGRYSVTSAVGMLPLSLQYGFDKMNDFLRGAHDLDVHFRDAPFEYNIPVLMALISIWNSTFLQRSSVAILPYCQALSKFPAHMQQVAMESLGKQVSLDGDPLAFKAGEIYFGEPGTNGQHSFYQLIHQGRVVPAEFIGTIKSQQSVYLRGEIVSNHDELMCNFFAQADALANGKSSDELRAEGVPPFYVPHKTFSGNRPSTSLLLPGVNPYTVGQLLALYEARVAAQGFVWGINAFDQWGVELGKVLATRVRNSISDVRTKNRRIDVTDGYNPSTRKMINRYLDGKAQLLYPEPRDVFPCDLIHAEGCPTPYTDDMEDETSFQANST